MPERSLEVLGRAASGVQVADRRLQRPERQPVGIDACQGELIGAHAIADHYGPRRRDFAARHGELADGRPDQPAAAVIFAARRREDADQRAVLAIIERDRAELGGIALAADLADVDQIIAIAHPHVGSIAAIDRQRPVVHGLPLIERRRGARDDAVVEREGNDRNAQPGDDQRREHLMRGQAGCLERDHLAILVHRCQRDDRAEQHREGQHERDDLRRAQTDIMPYLFLAVAGVGQDVAGLAQQIERLEDQHEPGDDHERADQEHPRHVERDGARREKALERHAAALRRRPGSQRVTALAIFEKTRSSAPIGWPPGT